MPHTSDAHSSHDKLLLAAYAAGDLPDAAAADAARLVASCSACAELVADLRAIAVATAALPALRRRRDFRLTEADAARLRGPWWRRALTTLVAPRFAFTRPLAATLTTLGVAGLLLAVIPTTQVGTTAFAPAAGAGAADMAAPAATAAPSEAVAPRVGVAATNPESVASSAPEENPAATAPPPAPSAVAPSASGPAALAVPASPAAASPTAEAVTGGGPNQAYSNASHEALTNTQAAGESSKSAGGQAIAPMEASRDSSGGGFGLARSPLLLLSFAFLAVGLAIFALRWTGRRLMGS